MAKRAGIVGIETIVQIEQRVMQRAGRWRAEQAAAIIQIGSTIDISSGNRDPQEVVAGRVVDIVDDLMEEAVIRRFKSGNTGWRIVHMGAIGDAGQSRP